MKVNHPQDVNEALSLINSIELALVFNSHKDKNRVVQKVCTHARHRFNGNLKKIVNSWRTKPNAYELYVNVFGDFIL